MRLSSRPPKVVEDLNQLIAESITVQRSLHPDWELWRDYVNGEQQDELALEKWQEQDYFPANICKSYVQTVLPILLSAQPTPFVVAEDRQQDGYAVEITKILHALRDRLRFNWTLHHIYTDALTIGTGVGKVWWDANAARGQGEVAFSWLDPFSVYPDPAARFIEDCEFVAICNKYTEPRIRRLFPDARFKKSDLGSAETRPGAAYGEGIQGRPGVVALGGPESQAEQNKYALWEVYHDFGEKLTIYSGRKVFYDGPNPTPGNNYPIFLFPINPVGDSLWGTPAIKDLIGIQNAINLTNMRIAENARLMGNGIWLTSDPSFSTTNEPGGIARYKGDIPPTRVAPPPLPNYFFAWLQMLYNLADTVSGVYDVTRGQRPRGVQSGVAIQQLQQSAISRISLPVQDFGQILEGVWQAILEVIALNYTGERTIGYSRDNVAETIKVSPELFGGIDIRQMKRVPYKYRCIVQPSGDLPISQAARVEQAMRLVGVIPPSMLVEQLHWPDSEKLVEELKQQEELQRRMQMAQMELQLVAAQAQVEQIRAQTAQMEAEAGQQLPPLEEVFPPDEQQVLSAIAGKVQAGEPLSEEEQAYLDALPEEDREVALAHIGGAR